jgi:hypothetical protein
MNANRRRHQTTAALSVGLAGLLLVAACSGSGSDSSAGAARDVATGQQAPSAGQGSSGGAAKGGDSKGGSASGGSGEKTTAGGGHVDPAAVAASSEYLARSASLALKVKGIAAAAASVRSISAANDGIVLSENIGGGGVTPLEDPNRVTATTYGEITISVPSDRLDKALASLAEVGTVIRRQSSSDNVREEYVDTESRVETMRASVDRVRALMSKATDIAQVVTLESELSRRQADLEALEAQLASLKDRVARSPIQVSLTTDATVIDRDDDTGFLAGLAGGWRAFTASVVMVLTVLGALLPFAVAAALVALPVWWGVRRRRSQRTESAASAAG